MDAERATIEPGAARPVPRSVRPPASPVGDYEILREIGRGGMAVVYLARPATGGDPVALKVVHSQYTHDLEVRARVAREARTAARLRHPNIVPLLGTSTLPDGRLALVSAYIAGRTLRHLLATDGRPPLPRAIGLLRDIASALAHAHAHGIVHRDVKPENIFIDDATGRAMLADFGCARGSDPDARLTMTGMAIGTPAYMAPEQIDGRPANPRSDIYSLGLIGWEMLTGRRPWSGEGLYGVLYKQKHECLPPLRPLCPDAPEGLVWAIEGALLKDPAVRIPSADAFLAHLTDAPRAVAAREPLAVAIGAERECAGRASLDAQPTIPFRRPIDVLALAQHDGHQQLQSGQVLVAAVAVAGIVFGGALLWRARPPGAQAAQTSPVHTGHSDAGGGANPTLAALRRSEAPPRQLSTLQSARRPPAGADRTTVLAVPQSSSGSPSQSAARASARIRGDADAWRDHSTIHLPAGGPVEAPSVSIAGGGVGTPRFRSRPPSATASGPPSRLSLLPGLPAAAALSAGGMHTCRLVGTDIYCWGANNSGQLGDGSRVRRSAPTRVQVSVPFGAVTAGITHTCALTLAGDALCWGSNDRGQLGDGSDTPRVLPARVLGAHELRVIGAGLAHTCALAAAGSVYCWGANDRGQLGDGTRADRRQAVRVRAATRFVALAVGWNHACALDATGRAYCWGDNVAGQLGDSSRAPQTVPVPVSGDHAFHLIAAGAAHTCALTPGGDAYCWGQDTGGQLGDGTLTDRVVPTRVATSEQLVALALGSVHSCALTHTGVALCWGRNVYGQIGDGTTTDRLSPTHVLGSHSFVALYAKGAHTCGSTLSGETFCWGFNIEGQLGDATRTNRPRPFFVEKPAG